VRSLKEECAVRTKRLFFGQMDSESISDVKEGLVCDVKWHRFLSDARLPVFTVLLRVSTGLAGETSIE